MTALDPIEALQTAFGDAVQDTLLFREQTTITVAGEKIVEICRHCRDTKGLEYNFLSDVTGIDYYPQSPRFAVAYHLYSMVHNRALRLNPALAGKVTVRFTISASGSVTAVTIMENTTNNGELEQEIIRKVRMWRFETIPEGDVTVTYPFVFTPAS